MCSLLLEVSKKWRNPFLDRVLGIVMSNVPFYGLGLVSMTGYNDLVLGTSFLSADFISFSGEYSTTLWERSPATGFSICFSGWALLPISMKL